MVILVLKLSDTHTTHTVRGFRFCQHPPTPLNPPTRPFGLEGTGFRIHDVVSILSGIKHQCILVATLNGTAYKGRSRSSNRDRCGHPSLLLNGPASFLHDPSASSKRLIRRPSMFNQELVSGSRRFPNSVPGRRCCFADSIWAPECELANRFLCTFTLPFSCKIRHPRREPFSTASIMS